MSGLSKIWLKIDKEMQKRFLIPRLLLTALQCLCLGLWLSGCVDIVRKGGHESERGTGADGSPAPGRNGPGAVGPVGVSGEGADSEFRLPGQWPDQVFRAVAEHYPEDNIKALFLNPPKFGRLRYRYWTEKHLSGAIGLVMVRAEEKGSFFGSSGPWYMIYNYGHDGEIFVTENLEWVDQADPIFALETVDQTMVNTTRIIRPLNLLPEVGAAQREFVKTPFADLPAGYAMPVR
jgi:hypothetical protein